MNQRAFRGIAGMILIVGAVACALSTPAIAQVQYQFEVLHGFGSGEDGNGPQGRLVFDQQGNLFGATNSGGTFTDGTVFELTPGANGEWIETILHNFINSLTDGAIPDGVVMDGAGNLYGAT